LKKLQTEQRYATYGTSAKQNDDGKKSGLRKKSFIYHSLQYITKKGHKWL